MVKILHSQGSGSFKYFKGLTPIIPPPPGVTLQAIDGETMLTPTTMSNNYFSSNGFTYATNTSFSAGKPGWYAGLSFDDPKFIILGCFFGLYTDVLTQFFDLNLNVTFALTGGSDQNILINNGVFASLGEDTFGVPTSPVGSYTVALQVDEDDPTQYILQTPLSIQNNRFWYTNQTWNTIVAGDLGGTRMNIILSANHYLAPSSTPRSIDVYSTDVYYFAMSQIPSYLQEFGCIVDGGYTFRQETTDHTARGSNYGNMIDVFRSYGNGANSGNVATSSLGNGATSRIPILSLIENLDGLVGVGAVLIKPPEYNWAVWSSLIHGTRGFDFFTSAFNHNGGYDPAIQPGQTISMYDQAKATHGLVVQLAPVINSPFALGFITSVSPHGYLFPTYEVNWLNNGIEACCHWYQGGNVSNSGLLLQNGFYIFATTRYGEAANPINQLATFSVVTGSSVTVIYSTDGNQGTTIPISGGQFSDTFTNCWSVRVYQVNL